jgi:hypothetical protein
MNREEFETEKAYLVGSLEKAIRKEDWHTLKEIADKLYYLDEPETESSEPACDGCSDGEHVDGCEVGGVP